MNFEQFHAILKKFCLLNSGSPLVVGVSGGADSLCLLHALHRCGMKVTAAHFDHQLRPDSGYDAQVVRSVAAGLGVPFVLGSADVAAWAQTERLSLEEAARKLRYRFLFEQARRVGAQAVAVGHTADDQVETILMHLLRGAGSMGLRGMAFRGVLTEWDALLPLVRPLLETRRAETVAYCQEHNLPFVSDATNQDTAFLRNRIRLELLPVLESYNPQIRLALGRMAQVLAGEAEIVQEAVDAAWDACAGSCQAGSVSLRLEALRRQSRAMQRALLRRAVGHLRPALRDVGFEDIERAVDFVQSPSRSGQMDWLQGLVLMNEPAVTGMGDERLIMVEAELADGPLPGDDWPQGGFDGEQVLLVGQTLSLGNGWELLVEEVDMPESSDSASRWECWLDADRLPAPLAVRRAKPGERFHPLGMEGHSLKLSDFWINEKLPRRARANWPLLLAGREIAWIPGFRTAHTFRLRPETRRVLHCVVYKR